MSEPPPVYLVAEPDPAQPDAYRVERAALEQLYALRVAELRILCTILEYPMPLTGKERKRQERGRQ